MALDRTADAAWRNDRRAAARQHHPDVGGETGEYLRVLAAIDARHRLPEAAATTRPVDRRSTARRAVRRWLRRTRRLNQELRGRLPRQLPGARRYTRL